MIRNTVCNIKQHNNKCCTAKNEWKWIRQEVLKHEVTMDIHALMGKRQNYLSCTIDSMTEQKTE